MGESELTHMGNTPWRRRRQKPTTSPKEDATEVVTSGRLPEAQRTAKTDKATQPTDNYAEIESALHAAWGCFFDALSISFRYSPGPVPFLLEDSRVRPCCVIVNATAPRQEDCEDSQRLVKNNVDLDLLVVWQLPVEKMKMAYLSASWNVDELPRRGQTFATWFNGVLDKGAMLHAVHRARAHYEKRTARNETEKDECEGILPALQASPS